MPNRGTSLGIVAVLAGLALVALFAFRSDAEPVMPVGETLTNDDAGSSEVDTTTTGSAVEPSAPDRRATEVTDPATPTQEAPAENVVFRGRVVDPDGNAIAGLTASVRAWNGIGSAQDDWGVAPVDAARPHPEAVTTAVDGRFELRCAPPTLHPLVLQLEKPGLVPLSGYWDTIEPGTVEDFGDVVMTPGARLTGRFVDAHGRTVAPPPEEPVELSIFRDDHGVPTLAELAPEHPVSGSLRPDGSFTFESAIAPGTWNVILQGLVPAERAQRVRVTTPATAFEMEVVRPEDLLRVAGIVVDDTGSPVADTHIEVRGTSPVDGLRVSTGRDGTFELVQRPSAESVASPFGLQATKRGFRTTTIDGVTWGRTGMRIVLARSAVMELLVVRAADGSPVEDYGVRVVSIGSAEVLPDLDGWKHPDGASRLTAIERSGEYRIHVRPGTSTGLAPAVRRVKVDLQDPGRLTMALPDAVEQPLRILHADGEPAVGSRVQLVDGDGEPLPEDAIVLTPDVRALDSPIAGIEIGSGQTDTEGRCTIPGPPAVPLTLRVIGNHATRVTNGVMLTTDERELRLAPGATVTIRLDPPEVVATWRRRAGIAATGSVAAEDRIDLPQAILRRAGSSGHEPFPPGIGSRGGPVPFDDRGIAVVRGVPAGRWHVVAQWFTDERYMATTGADQIVVESGEAMHYLLDVSMHRVGQVSGTLTVDGAPAAHARIHLQRDLDTPHFDGTPATENVSVETDANGAFAAEIAGATWRAIASVRLPESTDLYGDRVQVRVRPDVLVIPDTERRLDLRASLARTELRVVDPAGDPVAGLGLWSVGTDWRERPRIGETDTDGRTTVIGEAGSYRLACRVRSMVDVERFRSAMSKRLLANGGDLEAARNALDAEIELSPPITIPTDGVVEIRLPEAWDR